MKGWARIGAGFLVLAVLDTIAHVLFKQTALTLAPLAFDPAWLATVAHSPAAYGAIACYAATFFVWMALLRKVPVGPAFAASHLELVGTLLASVTIFHEQVSVSQWIGAACILVGIGFLAAGESAD